MAAASPDELRMGIGPVDALVDVARGPCVSSVAVSDKIAGALLGLAGAVGEPRSDSGQWLGLEGQVAALRSIEVGLIRLLGEVKDKATDRLERGLTRLCWQVQVLQRAVRDMVRGTLVQGEWVDRMRLRGGYNDLVRAWERVSFWLEQGEGADYAVLRGMALSVPRLPTGAPKCQQHGHVMRDGKIAAAQRAVSSWGENLQRQPAGEVKSASGDLRLVSESLQLLRKLDLPEEEVIQGGSVGELVPVQVAGGGRAFVRADGGGIVLEWRSEFRAPVLAADEDEVAWARRTREMIQSAVSGLLLGKAVNQWAEKEGADSPVQELRSIALEAVSEGGSHIFLDSPFGGLAFIVLQVTVDVCVPLAVMIKDAAWQEDDSDEIKAGVARECLSLLSTCEQSGAGHVPGQGIGALVIEGNTDCPASSVARGLAKVRICAGSVALLMTAENGEVGQWGDAVASVFSCEELSSMGGGFESRVATVNGATSGSFGSMLTGFERRGVWGNLVHVHKPDSAVAAVHGMGVVCSAGLSWARDEVGSAAMGQVWDRVIESGSTVVDSLWDGMSGWRIGVQQAGTINAAGRCGGVDVLVKHANELCKGCVDEECVGVWRCLLGGVGVVERVVEYVKGVVKGKDQHNLAGEEALLARKVGGPGMGGVHFGHRAGKSRYRR